MSWPGFSRLGGRGAWQENWYVERRKTVSALRQLSQPSRPGVQTHQADAAADTAVGNTLAERSERSSASPRRRVSGFRVAEEFTEEVMREKQPQFSPTDLLIKLPAIAGRR